MEGPLAQLGIKTIVGLMSTFRAHFCRVLFRHKTGSFSQELKIVSVTKLLALHEMFHAVITGIKGSSGDDGFKYPRGPHDEPIHTTNIRLIAYAIGCEPVCL